MIAPSEQQATAKHLLVIDAGNSTLTIGVWTEGDIRSTSTHTWTDLAHARSDLEAQWQAIGEPREVVCCSVVPSKSRSLETMIQQCTSKRPLTIGTEIRPPITIGVNAPDSVGMDRLCCAAAAYNIEGQSCVVIDLGSATTVDCVDAGGQFIGGAILPGLSMQAAALAEQTDVLPEVAIEMPQQTLGQNTADAIRSGIVFGMAGATRGLVERIATELGHWPVTILTGGHSQDYYESFDFVDKVIPHLCLHGIVLAYQESRSEP